MYVAHPVVSNFIFHTPALLQLKTCMVSQLFSNLTFATVKRS